MSEKNIVSGKHTLVEEGTELKGTISSNCPIVVMGKVEGDVTAPVVQVSDSGVVAGKVKVTELRSSGEVAGEIEAETVRIAGRVRAGTVLRARTLEVSLSRDKGTEVVFGECELNVGDEPSKQAAIDAALAAPEAPKPTPPPMVVTTKPARRKGTSEAWDSTDVAAATPPPPAEPASTEEGGERKRKTVPPPMS